METKMATVRTLCGRIMRVRAVRVGQSFGVVGQVVARNGRVVHETETRPLGCEDQAERDALNFAVRMEG